MKAFYTKKEYEELLDEATAGEASAQYALGYIYETGHISDMTEAERDAFINLYEACDWYEIASSDGWSVAQSACHRVREKIKKRSKCPSEKIEEIITRAKEGDLDSLYIAGCGFLSGENGWKLQPKKGEKFLIEAIDKGSVEACKSLAHYYVFCPSPSFVSKEKSLEYCDLAEKMEGKSTFDMEFLKDLIKNDLI